MGSSSILYNRFMEFMAGIGVLMALVFIYHWYFDFTYWMKRNQEKRWFQAPVLLNLIYMAACVVLPLALVNVLGYGDSAMVGHVEFQYFSSLILSILISGKIICSVTPKL